MHRLGLGRMSYNNFQANYKARTTATVSREPAMIADGNLKVHQTEILWSAQIDSSIPVPKQKN